jgi:hypothetical protein
MDLANIIQPSRYPRKTEAVQDHLTLKPPSEPVKLSVAEGPNDSGVFVLPDEEDPLTAAAVLTSSSPSTILPSYFDDVIVGRITCNNTTNGTAYTSFLDCYNDSYVGAFFNNGSGNGSATGVPGGEEPITDVILLAVTSFILGLMILITVIGKYLFQMIICDK